MRTKLGRRGYTICAEEAGNVVQRIDTDIDTDPDSDPDPDPDFTPLIP
jgi:hypothetical protein